MLDTKQSWDDLVRAHAPDAATRDAILANPLYQNITGKFVQSHDYIAMERLYEIHSSGRYDLIVVDTPPTRNAIDFLEAPEPHGRLLLQPAAALAHRARTGPGSSTSRRSPSTPWPTASSARSSSRTSPSSSSSSRRCTTASSSGPRRCSRTLVGPPHDVRRRDHARVGAGPARPSSSSRRCTSASSTSAPWCSTRCCRRTCSTASRRRSPTKLCRDAGPHQLAEASTAGGVGRRAGRAGARRGGGELPQLPGRGQARGRAAAPSCPARPRSWPPCPTSTTTSTTWPACSGSARSIWRLSHVPGQRRCRAGIAAAGHPAVAVRPAEVLEAGGNAFDAAVAAGFAGAVAEPSSRASAAAASCWRAPPDGRGGAVRLLRRHTRAAGCRRASPGAALPAGHGPRSRAPTRSSTSASARSRCPAAWPATSTSTAGSGGSPSPTWSRRRSTARAEAWRRLNAHAGEVHRPARADHGPHRPEAAAIYAPRGAPRRRGDRLATPSSPSTFRSSPLDEPRVLRAPDSPGDGADMARRRRPPHRRPTSPRTR